MKYLYLILISLFLSSCVSEIDPIPDVGSENGSCFENKTCDTGLICNSENICIKEVVDYCKDVNCNFGFCSVKDDAAACNCNEGYHPEGLKCIKNSLECAENEHEYSGNCINNTKMEDCTDVTPINATKVDEKVEVIYSDGYWSTPANCKWNCNDNFELVDGICKSTNEDPCENVDCVDNSHCIDGSCICNTGYELQGNLCILINNDPCKNVDCIDNSHCVDGSCICNTDYELQGNLCILINNDPCEGITCMDNASCNSDDAKCYCNTGYHLSDDNRSCISDNICNTLNCGSHSTCNAGIGECSCDDGFHKDNNNVCVANDNNACGGCSGHGECYIKENDDPVCACEVGYTPSNREGLDCVHTSTICKPGAIDYDVDGDGVNETWFIPNELECSMFELINFVRAVHDKEGSPESHKPLLYSLLWSAHARNHSLKMEAQGGLYHEDFPGGQNCAYNYSGTAMSHMTQYMGGDPTEPICKSASEGHCPPLSHHCNIMRPRFSYVGIGTVGSSRSYSTQNFY